MGQCIKCKTEIKYETISKLELSGKRGWAYCHMCDLVFHPYTGEILPTPYECWEPGYWCCFRIKK
jgi:hypothetical protein